MTDYAGNVARFSGFAAEYDRYRFRPPALLKEFLCRYAAAPRPELVVDLGCGTGPSTRFWADRAVRVIGVEPTGDMLEQARARPTPANVEYRPGFGHETGLPASSADVVTASQSFHWMEPRSTLAEIGRLLRPGGVFCAYHYDTEVVTGVVEVDEAVLALGDALDRLEREHGLKERLEFHGKDAHAKSLTACSDFRLTRAFHLHDVKTTTAERLVGGFETLGALRTLRDRGCSDDELGITPLRTAAHEHLGEAESPVLVSYAIHLGVRA